MRLYPDVPSRRRAAIAYDALIVLAILLFAYIGLKVHDTVDGLAVLGEGVRKAGGKVPFGIGSPVEDLGRQGEHEAHKLANLLGILTFALPTVVVLWTFVPRRVAQIKRLSLASRVLAGAPQRELAMRAAFSLPYGQLLHWTDDPLGDLAAQRYDRLVAAALDDAGLEVRTSGS